MLDIPFCDITESIQSMKIEEKIELKELLNHYLVEEQRDNIYQNFTKSRKEIKSGKIEYFKSAEELRNALEND